MPCRQKCGWRSRATARKNNAAALSVTAMARPTRIGRPRRWPPPLFFKLIALGLHPIDRHPHSCLPGSTSRAVVHQLGFDEGVLGFRPPLTRKAVNIRDGPSAFPLTTYRAAATATRDGCGATCAATYFFPRPGVMLTITAGALAATAGGALTAAAGRCSVALAIAGF